MKAFMEPEILIEKFAIEDVISTSGNGEDNTGDQEM